MNVIVKHVAASPEGLAGVAQLRGLLAELLGNGPPTIAERRDAQVRFSSTTDIFRMAPDRLGGVAVEHHFPVADRGGGVVLFAHGGAFVTGSCSTYRRLAADICTAVGLPLFSVDYSLAPEHPFPKARDEIVEAYVALLKLDTGAIALVGDSAGAGLMLQAALAIRDGGLPGPSAIVALSPWVDLCCRSASFSDRAVTDLMISREGLLADATRYAGELDLDDAAINPLYADLRGLPPVLIQVGEHELLHEDGLALAGRLDNAGVEVEVQVWGAMTHAWYVFHSLIPEARAAVANVAAFLHRSSSSLQNGRG